MKYWLPLISASCLAVCVAAGCRTAGGYRASADRAADKIIRQTMLQALGKTEPIEIETPADTLRRRLLLDQRLPSSGPASLGTRDLKAVPYWPWDNYLEPEKAPPAPSIPAVPAEGTLRLSLIQALQLGAAGNHDYQSHKEDVYRAALSLDLERHEFQTTFAGMIEALFTSSRGGTEPVNSRDYSASASLAKKFQTGAALSARLAIDVVQLLTQEKGSSRGLLADATITVPLLRGSGRHIVAEPLTQAERDLVYSLFAFERFKQTFAVQLAADYLGVLRQLDEVTNAEENYRSLVTAARRARSMANAGRLPEIQVDQATQDELRARSRWITARQSYGRRLDAFKMFLGLPVDADLDLDASELKRLTVTLAPLLKAPVGTAPDAATQPFAADAPVVLVEPGGKKAGPREMDEVTAIRLALERRLDLKTALDQVEDAQRKIVVAADQLRAGLTFTGSGSAGETRSADSAGSPNGNIRLRHGDYSASLLLDLPFDRTGERAAYRESFITLERTVRAAQRLEDQVKLDVRNSLRDLLETRENLQIQAQAVTLAQRRVASTDLFLKAGRAQIRDLLDAQESLVSAQNALTAALVSYRISELQLQRDTGLLAVDAKGLWQEDTHETPISEEP